MGILQARIPEWAAMPSSPPRNWRDPQEIPTADLPHPGTEPASSALAGRFFTTRATLEAPYLLLPVYYKGDKWTTVEWGIKAKV